MDILVMKTKQDAPIKITCFDDRMGKLIRISILVNRKIT